MFKTARQHTPLACASSASLCLPGHSLYSTHFITWHRGRATRACLQYDAQALNCVPRRLSLDSSKQVCCLFCTFHLSSQFHRHIGILYHLPWHILLRWLLPVFSTAAARAIPPAYNLLPHLTSLRAMTTLFIPPHSR